MPSTYTQSGVELIANGEQSGTWGTTTNTNLQIIDRMVSQAGTISLSGTTHTLTISDGILSDGQYGVLVFGGSPSGTNTVTISPDDAQRTYIVKNDSGEDVVLTQGSGGDVTVADGSSAIVYCDGAGSGAAVVDLTVTFVGTLTALGVTASAAELNKLDGATLTTGANGETTFADGVNEGFTTVTSSGGNASVDCRDGNVFAITLSENTTFTFSSPPSSGTAYGFTLEVVQDSTARTLTWPASVDWAGASAPTLSTGSGQVDVFVFFTHDGGTTWYGFVAGQQLG